MGKKNKKKQNKNKKAASHHKYLNAIGISSTDSCVFNSCDSKDSRQKQFKKERKKHSFDSRETWSLDYTLATWLYEHLMVFKDIASEEIAQCKFEIEKIKISDDGDISSKTVTVDGLQAVELACEYLQESLTCSFTDSRRIDYEQAALAIVSELLPVLWW